jgi:DNA-binding winged helix-turn-helix (wHTH) protein
MITRETKLKILEEILSTKEFHSSKTYTKLLTYLVKASIDNIEPKEFTIAVEVFNKDSNFNPSEDASVRVYISNLRKKLDHYYSHEGENDKYRITIPKGGYDLEFSPHTFIAKNNVSKYLKITVLISSLILLGLLVKEVYNMFSSSSKTNYSILTTPIWNNLYNSSNNKMVVLGNDLFFLEKINNEEVIIRKHNINTVEQFENYKNQHKNKNIIGITPYPFYPDMDFALISKLLRQILPKNNFNFKNSFNIKATDLLENDLFFFGSFRNLHFLNYVMKDSLFLFNSIPDNYFVAINEHDSIQTFKQVGEPDKNYVDYCLFRKIPGPNKNTIYVFSSFFGAARDATIKKMLSKNFSDELEKLFINKYGKMPDYFDILFKTSGFSRTAFTTNIEFIHKTNSSKKKWW